MLVEYLLRTERGDALAQILNQDPPDLHVPSLCDIEVAAALRRAIMAKVLTLGRANEALQDYLDLPLTRHDQTGLLTRVLELRNNFSAYDAAYVALAEAIGASVATADDRLATAIGAHSSLKLC